MSSSTDSIRQIHTSSVTPRWRPFIGRLPDDNTISPVAAASTCILTEKSPATATECICFRKRSAVTCTACGYFISSGRVSTPCGRHVNQFFLLDLTACPKCHAPLSSLKEVINA